MFPNSEEIQPQLIRKYRVVNQVSNDLRMFYRDPLCVLGDSAKSIYTEFDFTHATCNFMEATTIPR